MPSRTASRCCYNSTRAALNGRIVTVLQRKVVLLPISGLPSITTDFLPAFLRESEFGGGFGSCAGAESGGFSVGMVETRGLTGLLKYETPSDVTCSLNLVLVFCITIVSFVSGSILDSYGPMSAIGVSPTVLDFVDFTDDDTRPPPCGLSSGGFGGGGGMAGCGLVFGGSGVRGLVSES